MDYDDINELHKSAINAINELKQLDADKLLSGGVSNMEQYNKLTGRIDAFNDCQKILNEILRSFNES